MADKEKVDDGGFPNKKIRPPRIGESCGHSSHPTPEAGKDGPATITFADGKYLVVIKSVCLARLKVRSHANRKKDKINAVISSHVSAKVREAVKCRQCGGTDSVCVQGHEKALKEAVSKERDRCLEACYRFASVEGIHEKIAEVIRQEAHDGK